MPTTTPGVSPASSVGTWLCDGSSSSSLVVITVPETAASVSMSGASGRNVDRFGYGPDFQSDIRGLLVADLQLHDSVPRDLESGGVHLEGVVARVQGLDPPLAGAVGLRGLDDAGFQRRSPSQPLPLHAAFDGSVTLPARVARDSWPNEGRLHEQHREQGNQGKA